MKKKNKYSFSLCSTNSIFERIFHHEYFSISVYQAIDSETAGLFLQLPQNVPSLGG